MSDLQTAKEFEEYLIGTVGLSPHRRYHYYFDTGWIFFGNPAEFGPIAVDHFAEYPHATYEIDDSTSPDDPDSKLIISPPDFEGQTAGRFVAKMSENIATTGPSDGEEKRTEKEDDIH